MLHDEDSAIKYYLGFLTVLIYKIDPDRKLEDFLSEPRRMLH